MVAGSLLQDPRLSLHAECGATMVGGGRSGDPVAGPDEIGLAARAAAVP
jgi:hypothetical protein